MAPGHVICRERLFNNLHHKFAKMLTIGKFYLLIENDNHQLATIFILPFDRLKSISLLNFNCDQKTAVDKANFTYQH